MQTQQEYGIEDVNVYYLNEGEFVMPGFVDTHIHAPQYPNAGLGYDKQLLDWLTTYTFPLEKKYVDVDFAIGVYESVVRKTLASGTTTATYFATIHYESSLFLADIVERLGQRAFIGKVNMNHGTPEGYGEHIYDSFTCTEQYIRNIQCKRNELVQPIITPRFALNCDMQLMMLLGELAAKYNVHIQTHISESTGEVAAVQKLYPQCRNYADVYDRAGLLTNKTVLAHGIHLSDDELKVLAARGTSISHCPNSNTSLKSGLCDVRRLLDTGIKVGLGTDVSGGYSISILNAIRSALQTSTHIFFKKHQGSGYIPLSYHEAFYLATLGGAKALSVDDKTGNFKVGKDFDALIVNMRKPGPIDILDKTDIKDLIQKFLYTGDDRNISKVYVAGRQVK
ncbi:guanine deaminase isoform X2 [Cryptotermes secundus]|nr:guanine deaminase isoform X2 [Cryptotermes secundus]XP_023719938.1 guanine deaminase isoform X2 [Cryptotermes secundus]XP_033610054.1 guanine deaminase isoform X2 [Cryptotermes secundus]XP_033610055.1 guanine deaminase isoform X2 [Cryptotermes secundus]XP_033610056.1 guanine deaminase isoform X2 [Cryptotermes secundus]XP_033610057.1 guanine deaminase isoform X2 [Cryptotermes secundus]XP_033610058.1 guanine deaminase isoform X2 [Cryptotermes secundus]XP_033610059.1 guanine deaminase isofor